MFTLQACASALRTGDPAPGRPSPPRRARLSSTLPPTQAPHSSQERENAPFVFSELRTLSFPRKPQPAFSQQVPHSLPHSANLTAAFPITSALFVRSWAQERKLTPLLSIACARFRRNGGYPAKFGLNIDCQQSLLIFGAQAHAYEAHSQGLRFRECATRLVAVPRPTRNSFMNPLMSPGRVA
jgi:hypothetical protein